MITRQTWLQLVAFAVISIVGVTYTAFTYAGLDRFFVDTGYLVSADFEESGGIFEAAEVTYRGVPVGSVEELSLIEDGVRVTMRLKPGTEVPADARALVANRSAVGEQYVDLLPQSEGEPFLDEGDVIPKSRTETPITPAELIVNLDDFVSSVDTRDLAVVLDELGQAFDGAGDSLQRLVDSGDLLTQAAIDNLDETKELLRAGEIGTSVRSCGMTSPSARNCSPRRLGCRSTYCSPTAERFATIALASSGTSVPGWMRMLTRTPSSMSSRSSTVPAGTPR